MPNVQLLNMSGEKIGEIELNDAIFGTLDRVFVMHAAVVNYLANQRQGTQSTLTRTEVRGGGRKPWRQKVPAMHVRARPALRSGPTAVSLLVRNRVITATP